VYVRELEAGWWIVVGIEFQRNDADLDRFDIVVIVQLLQSYYLSIAVNITCKI